ncbi:Polycystin family receptor for egg jelly [Dirofilaria immitis]
MALRMGQRDGLLLDSDDSDIPDLDLPTASIRKGRSRLFSRARQNVGSVIVKQQSYSVQIVLMLLLSAVVIAIIFLGFFASYILSQLEQLRNDPKHEVVTRELEIIKYELNRIKIDIDMLRLTTSSPGTPIWNASSLLYTRLEDIESQISSIADKIQEKFNNHLENDTINWISERINAVADACSQGCETVSKLIVFNNGSKTLDSTSDKLKKKRSKIPQWSFTRDIPIVFTRTKHHKEELPA